MLSHLVLMKPRPDLSTSDRERLIAAFERAVREIPTVQRVRVGRRITHGAGYEARMPDAADYFVMIDFEDAEGLATYLRHPAHEDLGTRFNDSLAAAFVYDFEDVEELHVAAGGFDLRDAGRFLEAKPTDHAIDETRPRTVRPIDAGQDGETLVDGLDDADSHPPDRVR
jgi:hypothetical protein